MKAKTIDEREIIFRKEVQEIGQLIYTHQLIMRFSDFWTEPDRGKGRAQKMRFEKERTFEIKRRLVTWARNNFDEIVCFLTESQRTLAQKKYAFAVSLEPFLEQYGRNTLNDFYKYYSQPENKPNPTRLKWESEEFWELSTRLSIWGSRNN